MFITRVLCRTPAKGNTVKTVQILTESVVSGHRKIHVKEKGTEKSEFVLYDPRIRMDCVFKEIKKIKTN